MAGTGPRSDGNGAVSEDIAARVMSDAKVVTGTKPLGADDLNPEIEAERKKYADLMLAEEEEGAQAAEDEGGEGGEGAKASQSTIKFLARHHVNDIGARPRVNPLTNKRRVVKSPKRPRPKASAPATAEPEPSGSEPGQASTDAEQAEKSEETPTVTATSIQEPTTDEGAAEQESVKLVAPVPTAFAAAPAPTEPPASLQSGEDQAEDLVGSAEPPAAESLREAQEQTAPAASAPSAANDRLANTSSANAPAESRPQATEETKAPEPPTAAPVSAAASASTTVTPIAALASAPAPVPAQEAAALPVPPPATEDNDTRRQAEHAREFAHTLLAGIDFSKHGRRGFPHRRTLRIDTHFTELFWSDKADARLPLDEVVQVSQGVSTEVLRRSGKARDAEHYVSCEAASRTLDMELPSVEERDRVASGLRALIDVHRNMCAQEGGHSDLMAFIHKRLER